MKDSLSMKNNNNTSKSNNNFPTTLKNIKLKIRLIQKRKQLESINSNSTTTNSNNLTTTTCKGENRENTSGRNHPIHYTFLNLTNQLADLKFDNNNNNNNNNNSSGGVYFNNDEDDVRKVAAAETRRRKNSLFKAYFNKPAMDNDEEHKREKRRRRRRRRNHFEVLNHHNHQNSEYEADDDDVVIDKKVRHHNDNTDKKSAATAKISSSLTNNNRKYSIHRRRRYDNNKTTSSPSSDEEEDDDDDDDDEINNTTTKRSVKQQAQPIYVFRKGGKTYLANLIEEENEEGVEELVEFIEPENSQQSVDSLTNQPDSIDGEFVEVEELPVKLKEICEQNKLILRKFYGNFGLLMNYISPSLDYKIGELDMSLLSRGLKPSHHHKSAPRKPMKSETRLTLSPSRQTINSIDMSAVHWPSALSTTLRKPATLPATSSSLLLLSRIGVDQVTNNQETTPTTDEDESTTKRYQKLPNVEKSGKSGKKRHNLDILKISGKSLIKEPIQGITNVASTWTNSLRSPKNERKSTQIVHVKVVRDPVDTVVNDTEKSGSVKLPEIETKRSSCEERQDLESKSIQQFVSQRSVSSIVDYKKVYDYLPLDVDKIQPAKRSDEILINKSDQNKDQKQRFSLAQKAFKSKRIVINGDFAESSDKIKRSQTINPISHNNDVNTNIKEENEAEFCSESLLLESNLLAQKTPVRKSIEANKHNNNSNSNPVNNVNTKKKTADKKNELQEAKKQQQQQQQPRTTTNSSKKTKNIIINQSNNINNTRRKTLFDLNLDVQLPKSQGIYTQVLTSTSQVAIKSLLETSTSLFTDIDLSNSAYNNEELSEFTITNNNANRLQSSTNNFDSSSTNSIAPLPPIFDRAKTEFMSSLQEVNKLKRKVLQRMQQNQPSGQVSAVMRPDLLPMRAVNNSKDADIYKFYERSRTSFIFDTAPSTIVTAKSDMGAEIQAADNNDSIDDS